MSDPSILPRIIKDLFKKQWKWTLAFIGIMLLVNLLKMGRAIMNGTEADDYFSTVLIAGNIYMFVIGITCIAYLTYFVEHGIPRKLYFKSTLLVAAGLSLIIPTITFFIHKGQQLVLGYGFHSNGVTMNTVVTEIDKQTSLIDDLVVSVVTTPYIDPESQTVLALAIFSLNLFTYYLAGWLIGTSFLYFGGTALKYPFIGGLIFIIISALFLSLHDTFMRISLKLPVLPRFTILKTIPQSLALIIILSLILITILLIQQMTKKVAIKV